MRRVARNLALLAFTSILAASTATTVTPLEVFASLTRPWDDQVGEGLVRRDHANRFAPQPPSLVASPHIAIEPDIDVEELVELAQSAIRHARTYRYTLYSFMDADETDRQPMTLGEVDLARGVKSYAPDGTDLEYFDGRTLYEPRGDGTWKVRVLPQWEPLHDFLGSPTTAWELLGKKLVAGDNVYVIQRTHEITYENTDPLKLTETFWIDASTFLPVKRVYRIRFDQSEGGYDTIYSDFGDPVDIRPPAAALLPTPAQRPLPATDGGQLTIELNDIYFDPRQLTIPANVDVAVVLANVGAAPHNFSIDELGIGVDVETGTSDFVIVNAPPGEYAFHCNVPGHTEAGMVGTLIVGD